MNETEEYPLPQLQIWTDEQHESVVSESKWTKHCVLIGSCILQLPIWGFAMSYGVFQEYYSNNWTFHGDHSITGVIGTTANGVMYLSMPFLFALFTRCWAHRRQLAASIGTAIACLSFFLSSYSTSIGHLLVSQGITSAIGCALIYSPTTLSLGEWYATSGSGSNRAVAYGIVLSCKNIVGTSCPFMLRALINAHGYATTLRVWTAIVAGTSILSILLIPTHPSRLSLAQASSTREHSGRQIPWSFLRHRSIYLYSTAIIFQSSGYGIPQTYLSTYARDVSNLSQTSGTMLLALFNAPGIIASSFFAWLSDNNHLKLSVQTTSSIPPITCAVATFLLWGLTNSNSKPSGSEGGTGDGGGGGTGGTGAALLILFSLTFGFFSGGYSATWGGMLKQLEREAAERNEALDPGMVYGLLNGVRGVGYASGGFAEVRLLSVGSLLVSASSRTGQRDCAGFGIGSSYGPLIVFTGVASLLGGGGLFFGGGIR